MAVGVERIGALGIAVLVFFIAVLRIRVVAVGVERIRVLGRVYTVARRQARAVTHVALHTSVDALRRAWHRIVQAVGDHRDARLVAVVVHATWLFVARL